MVHLVYELQNFFLSLCFFDFVELEIKSVFNIDSF